MQFSVLFLLLSIIQSLALSENASNKDSRQSNDLSLLGYIRGYIIGQQATMKYPGFVLSPIFIVPVLSLKEDVEQIPKNEKLKYNITSMTKSTPEVNNSNIEANFREALDRGSRKDLRQVKSNETVNIVEEEMKNDTTDNALIETNVTANETVALEENQTSEYMTTDAYGVYPNAAYTLEGISSLTITVKPPDQVLYPPLANEQWKNFTRTSNVTSKKNTTVSVPSDSLNGTVYQSVNVTDSSIKGVYPAALYNNAEIDQLSITTNSYTNTPPLPPPQDDRWSSFASLNKMFPIPSSNEFKPLAGLYYDGFLHKPILRTRGFVPYNHYRLH